MSAPACPLCGHPADLVGLAPAKAPPARAARAMPPSERVDRRAWARWEAAMEDMGGREEGDD